MSGAGDGGPRLAGTTLAVGLATGIGYLGFLARDILTARLFGLGEAVALYQLASYLPLFLASTLAGPLYSSLVPEITMRREAGGLDAAWLGRLAGAVSLAFAVAAAASLALVAGQGFAAGRQPSFLLLAALAAAVLAASGAVVMRNALLAVHDRPVAAAAAQALVPLVAIPVLLAARSSGAFALAVGALAGQAANLLAVRILVARTGIAPRPARWSWPPPLEPGFPARYGALVLAGLLLYAYQPIGVVLAARLGEPAVAALAIGGKATVFLNGLAWVGVAYVVLPRFAQLAARGSREAAAGDLADRLYAGTLAAMPVSLALAMLAEPIVRLMFEGGAFAAADTVVVARVMAWGLLQLPCFVVVMLYLKFAIAHQVPARVAWALLPGTLAGLLAASALMDGFGVAGIALGGTIGIGVSAFLLVAGVSHRLPARERLRLAGLLVLYALMAGAMEAGHWPLAGAAAAAVGLVWVSGRCARPGAGA